MLDLFSRGKLRLALPAILLAAGAGTFGLVRAADHDEAPAVMDDPAADIADTYSFRSPTDPENVVLAMTLSDFAPAPDIELGRSAFSKDVLYQFNIDNDGDAVEDVVIQAFVTGSQTNQKMTFVGPVEPEITGTNTIVRPEEGKPTRVDVSTGPEAIVAEENGMKLFAGVRDDPFFFDLVQFGKILNGEAGGFRDPGVDSFGEFNVYSIVVEVPIEALGGNASGDTGLGFWGSTYRR
ncbi:MAG: DUF4331 family protein [Gemmatimonadota bacterium]|nr:DUF4331 family protein [Gemmatimonadota bacterium]